MLPITLSNCHTISNIDDEDKKACQLVVILATWLMLSLAASPAFAQVLPVSIAWDVPLENGEAYDLEIADSPTFATTLLRTVVRTSGFSWNAPNEGVYHWRLMRAGHDLSSNKTIEVSALASGSFAVLDPILERIQPAKITWQPVQGADRYKVYLQENTGKPRIMTVTATSMMVPSSKAVLVLEVVPFLREVRTTRNYQMTPSLALDSGLPPPPPPVVPPPPAVTELISKTVTVYESPALPQHRRLLSALYGTTVQEDLGFQKLATNMDSSAQQFGVGANFWVNPNRGLIVSGSADYHEHQNSRDVISSSNLGTTSQRMDQSRFVGDLSIGYNLLDFFGVDQGLMVISGTAAVTQLPFIEKLYSVTADTQVPLFKDRYGLIGGSVSTGYLGQFLSVVVEAGGTAENSHQGRYNFARAQIETYPARGWALLLSVFGRMQQGSVCDSDPAQCLFYGRSTTESFERGVAIGFGSTDLGK